MRRILATVPALALIAPGAAAGTIESYLSFQARLTDNQGEPLGNGYHTLDFFVYAEPSGGTPIGAILNVMVHLTGGNGVVSTPIGPADLSWFADAPRYIGVTIDDVDDNPVGDEFSPRVWLTAVPFALRAFDLPPSTNLSVATGYVAGNFKVDGNIGVGILNPAYRLQILAPLLPPSGFLGTGRGGLAVSGGALAAIDFTSTAGGGFAAPGARIAANVESSGTWLTFGTSQNQGQGVTNEAMVIGPGGRIGVGGPPRDEPGHFLDFIGPAGSTGWTIAGNTGTFYVMQVEPGGDLRMDGLSSASSRLRFTDMPLYMGPAARAFEPGHVLTVAGPVSVDSLTASGTVGGTSGEFGEGASTTYAAPSILNIVNDSGPPRAIRVLSRFHGQDAGEAAVFELQDAGIGNSFVRINNKVAGGVFDLIEAVYSGESRFRVSSNGVTSVDVLQIQGGQDLAEAMTVRAVRSHGFDFSPEPGMVVVIDPDAIDTLKLTSTAYDPLAAGIIAGANGLPTGMIMDLEGDGLADGEHPIALAGRVWCWCDATEFPIQVGDMLTTSDTPGHAMKVTDRQRAFGAVIGKALTELPEGRGLVKVLVGRH